MSSKHRFLTLFIEPKVWKKNTFHFSENLFSFSKWVLEWAFISKMWFFFLMCLHLQNVKGFVSVVFLFPKNTIVNKNLYIHYK